MSVDTPIQINSEKSN